MGDCALDVCCSVPYLWGLRLRKEVVDCFDDIRKVRTIYMLGGS